MSEPPRERDGLLFYRPSNGTEFQIFQERCARCKHWIDDLDDPQPGRMAPPYATCKWGVLDRLYIAMTRERGDIADYHDPADLRTERLDGLPVCPAECLRFTPKDYGFDDRDPPSPDVPGQMLLGEDVVIHEPAHTSIGSVGHRLTAQPVTGDTP